MGQDVVLPRCLPILCLASQDGGCAVVTLPTCVSHGSPLQSRHEPCVAMWLSFLVLVPQLADPRSESAGEAVWLSSQPHLPFPRAG